MKMPPDWKYRDPKYIQIGGCCFKVGRFDWIFTWVNGRWMRSSHTLKTLKTFKDWPTANLKIEKHVWKDGKPRFIIDDL